MIFLVLANKLGHFLAYIFGCTFPVVHFLINEHSIIAHDPLDNEYFPFVSEPVWCPYLLVPRASLTLKAFLLHQPWDEKYSLDIMNM